MQIKFYLLTFFLFLICFCQALEDHNFYVLNADNGLPHETVWCTIQDRLGFIWIGTANGLCRYDGKNIEVFKTEDGLWGNSITSLTENDDGDIIAACFKKGVNRINICEDGNTIEKLGIKLSTNWDVYFDEGKIIFPNFNNIHSYTLGIGANRAYPFDEDYMSNAGVTSLIQVNDSIYSCISDNKLIDFNLKNNNFHISEFNFPLFCHIPYLKAKKIISAKGKIIVYEKNKIIKEFSQGLPDNSFISEIYSTISNDIWINSIDNGLYVKKSNTDHFEFAGNYYNLDLTNVNDINQDNEGNIYLATWGKGLIVSKRSQVKNYTYDKSFNLGNIKHLIYNEKSKCFIFSTNANLYSFNSKEFDVIELEKQNALGLNVSLLSQNKLGNVLIKSNSPNNICLYNNGVTLFVTLISSSFFKNEFESTVYTFNKDRHFDAIVSSMQFCEEINIHEIINDSTRFVSNNIKDSKLRQPEFIHYKDDRYLGIDKTEGIILLDLKQNKLTTNLKDKNNYFPETLNETRIFDLKIDSLRNIFIGTENGLYAYIDSIWIKYNNNEIIKAIEIRDITFDENEHLWLSTLNGLFYFDRKNFYQFKKNVGFLSNQLDKIAYNSENKEIFLTCDKGISIVSKDELISQIVKKPDIPFRIATINSENRILDLNSDIILDPLEKELSIDLNVMTYSNPDELIIKYKLNDNNWNETKGSTILLENLTYGIQSLFIKAGFNQTNFTDVKIINFKKKAPFYLRTWFIILSILSIITAVTLFTRNRINKAKLRAEIEIETKKKINLLEQRALGIAMNPHFVFNALNSINYFMNSNNNGDANYYLAKFSKLIRMNFDALGTEFVILEKEIDRLKIYLDLEKLRYSDSFNYEILIDEDIETDLIEIPNLIIQPFVENAIWHGIQNMPDGKIIVQIKEKAESLIINITDNGIGFDNSKNQKKKNNHHSRAISVTKERIMLLGQSKGHHSSVSIKQNGENGTTVKLCLPVIEVE